MNESQQKLEKTVEYLKTKKRILFLTTSNRWAGGKSHEMPKSTQLASLLMQKLASQKIQTLDIPTLKIFPCEGNVSSRFGNSCGLPGALLKDEKKNPSGCHRCWASINNPDDELWKVSKALLESDCVLFFGSVRWGQMDSYYQKLIERLTWLENRHASLGESNLLEKIDAGLILVGQNWNGESVVKTQKQVLDFYGFHVVDDLCWNWQYTEDATDERPSSYLDAAKKFEKTFFKK